MPTAIARSPEPLPTAGASSWPDSVRPKPDNSTIPDGLYQLLGLVAERGAGGVVDKFIINQDSVGRLVEFFAPGAHKSITRIDFAALDKLLLKPVGIYGSEHALVDVLAHLGVDIRHLHLVGSRQKLPTGLYFVPGVGDDNSGALRGYVLYWPEPATWDDNATPTVKRNRVTFMRYLTKITHQVVCLISDEHSAALVWKDGNPETSTKRTSGLATPKFARRVYSFGVQRTKEQRESVSTLPGSTIEIQEDLTQAEPSKPSLSLRLIAGETRQALISGVEVPPRWLGKKSTRAMSRADVAALMKDTRRTVELADEMSEKATSTLLNMGLRERHSELVHEWRRDITHTRTAKDDSLRHWANEARDALAADLGRLKNHFKVQVVAHVAATFTWLGDDSFEPVPPTTSIDPERVIHHQLEDLDATMLNFASFNRIDSQHFQLVKSRFIVVTNVLQDQPMSPAMFKRLDNAITTGNGYYSLTGDLIRAASAKPPAKSLMGRIKTSFRHIFKMDHRTVKDLVKRAGGAEDIDFLNTLRTLDWYSHMPRSCSELFRLARQWLSTEIETYTSTIARQISDDQLQSALEVSESAIALRFKDLEDERFNTFKRDLNNAERARQHCEILELIRSLSESEATSEPAPTERYKLSRTTFATDPAHCKFKVQPVGLTAADIQSITADPEVVPRPIVLASAKWGFQLPDSSSLRSIQIFNNGRYLILIVDKEESKARFYLESDTTMAAAITERKSTHHIDLSRVGPDFLVAVGESKRLVGILSRSDNRLFIYTMDESFTVLRPRNSELDILRLADGGIGANIMDMAFVSGKEEVVLVDDTGTSRILSLTTESFRPGTVQLPAGSHSIMSSPDGSCIFLTTVAPSGEIIGAKACHEASFGTSSGFELDLAGVTIFRPQITSFVNRSNAYFVFSSPGSAHLHTLKIQVITKSSDFAIREQFSPAKQSLASETGTLPSKHNSLLDCYADVWGRYPVAPTISRASPVVHSQPPSICFVSSQHERPFAAYFRDMIRNFELSTKKPTRGFLGAIKVSATRDASSILSRISPHVSTFPAGLWLIELLCLIPLHLAIADGNAFVPLKDGVRSSDFERALLGLNHVQVADRITIGWYESILNTYYAKRPVRVVSSMGEQSVGKSYALNHFVDTSFAGSAMRCTEGAWLSVTPTEHELVVALDFEGIHSIERTPQEDMLLVLFNVAISNLVLFRNNFALSRDVAGMFTSFQSSAALLGDPASHPNLFQSSLAIIIKDVVDVDTDEIAKEFADKFRRIVRDKQGDNFITTLHRGQLDIIPWPVIQSKEFYTEMRTLREKLEGRPSTHGTAATFLRTLKLLMARLKASDWASLDPNLAEGRVAILMDSLLQALSRGYTGDDPDEGQLKNLDTRQAMDQTPSTRHVFSLASDGTLSTAAREGRFAALVADFSPKTKRQHIVETDYVDALNKHLRTIAKMRIRKVQDWVKANIARFPSDQPDVGKLITQFEKLKKELMHSIDVCGGRCEHCRLLCLRPKHHDGEHSCTTDHRCIHPCDLDGERPCGFPAGHNARHICDVKLHLCGEICSLRARKGCLKECSQNVGHDGEHICEASSHACGRPCRLGGLGLCKMTCAVDCRKPHDQHMCEDRFKCPAKCKLCDRLCATPNHAHALESNALHLCGREHPCDKWCEAPGMCDVSPTALRPAVSATRTQKHSQKATRRVCAQKVPPNKLKHEGQHVHSTEANIFHFCGERIPGGCHCVCELPLNHPQDHSTGHGVFEQTTWKKAEGRGNGKSKGWFS